MIANDNTVDKRKYILENFGKALKEKWLEVYYQPIIRTSSGRVCGEEALVRWDDPIYGVLNPVEFVPVLESVNLIDRLDLFVLEECLNKIKRLESIGLYVVVHSINFSQIDFYSGDIVAEVSKRVEESGVSPSLIAIDVTEKSCTNSNIQVLSQLEKFRNLGFKIWMDDYGSGDSAPILLQKLQFDMLKINIGLVSQLTTSASARIVITELVRMAMALGIEVAAEGVENSDQVEFLNEIGCAKLQGFYYCKPVSLAQLIERYNRGQQIGFENPLELDYYSAVGHVNLYDLSFIGGDDEQINDYFDTMPMAILQTDSEKISLMRCNKNFRKFIQANLDDQTGDTTYYFKERVERTGYYTMNSIRQCGVDGKRVIIDDRTKNGKTVQLLLQKLAENPVTGVSAVVVVILSITERPNKGEDLSYNYIARALAEDYIKLFFVNLDTDRYVEYAPDGINRDLSMEKQGEGFFTFSKNESLKRIYKDDKERVAENFTKENVVADLEKYGKYTITYRVLLNNEPTFVNMKVVRVRTDNNHILVGITNVDAQIKQQEAFDRIKEEHITYARISALSGDIMSVYTVNPETDYFELYKSTKEYEHFDIEPKGEDFFGKARANIKKMVHPDDLKEFMEVFTKENILKGIEEKGMFTYTYRLSLEGDQLYVTLKAAIVEELDGPRLIIGLININEQARKEIEYAATLSEAEDKAFKDVLTGVKNKHAYTMAEEEMDARIKIGDAEEFAIIVCDLNNLKLINDTRGHQTGDLFIREGCKIICNTFSHSPVFRVGGDEFAVIAKGSDYENLDMLIDLIKEANQKNQQEGNVTIAVGAERSDGKSNMNDIFDRADAKMYLHKKRMKNLDR